MMIVCRIKTITCNGCSDCKVCLSAAKSHMAGGASPVSDSLIPEVWENIWNHYQEGFFDMLYAVIPMRICVDIFHYVHESINPTWSSAWNTCHSWDLYMSENSST